MKTRFSNANPVKSLLSEKFGRDIFELDTNENIGLNAFSKPLTKVFKSTTDAINAALLADCIGDILVRPVNYSTRPGWQAFERRTAKGRVCVPNGSHGHMVSVGSGRIFIA